MLILSLVHIALFVWMQYTLTYRTVKDTIISTGNAVTVCPEEQMTQVLQKMQDSGVRRVLMIQNNLLKGIITANDVANWLQRKRDSGQIA